MSYKLSACGDRKVQFVNQKYFLQKMRKKRVGMSYKIHCYLTKFPQVGIEKYNTKIEFCVTKYFSILQKMLKKKGYVVQN